jgi:hypothetical protein
VLLICSNLAELLIHSRHFFEEGEKLYKEGLEIVGGHNDVRTNNCSVNLSILQTIEIALAGLQLAKGELDEGLPHLER